MTKMHRMRTVVIGISVLAGACSGPSQSPDRVFASAANPAAAYCEANDGIYVPAQGGSANCILASGQTVNALDHYEQNVRR